MFRTLFLVAFLMLVAVSIFAQVTTVPQLMNFQGRLAKPDGTPVANGTYSVRFSLWDAATNGTEKWNQTVNPIAVKNGTFATLLSGFPAGTFNGNLWLEIKVGNDNPLTPRQQLVSVAYAMKANSVPDGSIGTAQLASGAVTAANIASGTITSSLLAPGLLNFWALVGNSGTNPATNFLGTTDNQPMEIRVNNQRIQRLEPAKTTTDVAGNDWFAPNLLAGYSGNTLTSGVVGATVAGGGIKRTLNGTTTFLVNSVTDSGGTVGGGAQNQAGDNAGTVSDAMFATVAGGWLNTASGGSSFVGGGFFNTAQGSTATVGGGQVNKVTGTNSTIGGGQNNTINGTSGAIAGGLQNIIADNQAVIGGGFKNTNNGYAGTISGGQENVIGAALWATICGGAVNMANGNYSTVAAGYSNTAQGNFSFAAGTQAKAMHPGAFVWADNSAFADFASTGNNQFLIRAAGGVGINTGSPDRSLTILNSNGAYLNLKDGSREVLLGADAGGGIVSTMTNHDLQLRAGGNVTYLILKANGSVGIGTTSPAYKLDVNGSLRCFGFTNSSDARWKTDIHTFGNALDAILHLRGVTFDWNRDAFPKINFPAGRQIGFVAQEVEKILPELVTTDEQGFRSVAYQNIVPVLVEAVKQQQKQIEEFKAKNERIGKVEAENAELKARLDALLARVERVEANHSRK